MEQIITALDLGSFSVKVVIGMINEASEIEIIGCGSYLHADIKANPGIKSGAIVNIDSTIKAIVESVSEAELMSGMDIESVLVNVTGKTVQAGNSKGVVAITNRDKNISEADVIRVIESSQNSIRIPNDQSILHVISREFAIDSQRNIKDPVGMNGIRLEADVHIISAGKVTMSNIEKTVKASGLKILDMTLSSIASSEAVLTSTEKDIGVIVIDIGSSVCDVIIYLDGGIVFSAVIPFGSNHVTSDLAIGLKTSIQTAESIKKMYGHVLIDEVDPTESIEVPSFNNRESTSIKREDIVKIIEPRVREIFELIDEEVLKSGKKKFLSGGIILTGGGSLLGGIEAVAESVLGLPTITARPANLSGLTDKVSSPEFSTAVGLIKYTASLLENSGSQLGFQKPEQGWSKKLKSLIEEYI